VNDFLTTFLVEDHRRELLTEARADALAHEALAGRKPWWHRLVRRTTDAAPKPAATSLNGHMAASIISAR
jgi:hypothetical protein